MKWIGIFLAAGAIIATAQAVAVALALIILVGFTAALFTCPRELFGLVGLCLVAGLIQTQPLAFLAVVALMVMAKIAVGSTKLK